MTIMFRITTKDETSNTVRALHVMITKVTKDSWTLTIDGVSEGIDDGLIKASNRTAACMMAAAKLTGTILDIKEIK